jgi:hypothetical protein
MFKTVRLLFVIAAGMLLAAPFAQSRQDGERPARQRPPTVQQLQDALNTTIKITDALTIPLPQALRLLEDSANHKGEYLAIDLDLAAIKESNPNSDIESTPVRFRKAERPIPHRVVLQEILGQFESGSGEARMSFAIVEGRILVGPRVTLMEKMLNQPVSLTVEGLLLRKVLRMLTEQTGVNLVLDARGKEEPKVSMEVQDMSLKTAVELLAEMADLKSVCLNEDGFFITTRERAERLRKERTDRPAAPSEESSVLGALIGAGAVALQGRRPGALQPASKR